MAEIVDSYILKSDPKITKCIAPPSFINRCMDSHIQFPIAIRLTAPNGTEVYSSIGDIKYRENGTLVVPEWLYLALDAPVDEVVIKTVYYRKAKKVKLFINRRFRDMEKELTTLVSKYYIVYKGQTLDNNIQILNLYDERNREMDVAIVHNIDLVVDIIEPDPKQTLLEYIKENVPHLKISENDYSLTIYFKPEPPMLLPPRINRPKEDSEDEDEKIKFVPFGGTGRTLGSK